MIWLCFFSIQGNPLLPTKIKFSGNHFIKNPRKLFISNNLINDSIAQVWQDSLRSVYTENGFFWTQITIDTITNKNQKIFEFIIKENKKAKIKDIKIDGNENFQTADLLPYLNNNLHFSNQVLNSQIKNLLNFYANNGFPFTIIEPQYFSLDNKDKTISYQLKITEGPKTIIHYIEFNGNQSKEHRLKQIVGLRTPTYYNQSVIKRNLSRLNTQGIKINEYNIIKTDTTYTLQIDVKEDKFQSISGAISYLRTYQEINGFLYLSLNNLFFTLRKLNLGWEHYGNFSNFKLNYTDPWLLGFIFTTDFTYNTYDTFYAKINFDITTTFPILDYLSLGFLSGYEILNSGLVSLTNYNTYWLGQSVLLELNKNALPSYTLDLNTKLGTRKSLSNRLLVVTDLQNRLLLPFIHKTNFSFDIRLKNIYSDKELTMSDSLYLGGTKTLRGYQENEFLTARFLLTRNELNILSTKATNFFFFTDIGHFQTINKYETKLGYGLGIRTNTKIGAVGIDYGIPLKNKLLNGKIHLNFSNIF